MGIDYYYKENEGLHKIKCYTKPKCVPTGFLRSEGPEELKEGARKCADYHGRQLACTAQNAKFSPPQQANQKFFRCGWDGPNNKCLPVIADYAGVLAGTSDAVPYLSP